MLTCKICSDLFKDPRILRCGHSFCRSCLERIFARGKSRKMSCPTCAEVFRNLNINNLTKNLELMAFSKPCTQEIKPQVEAQVCELHALEKTYFCRACRVDICLLCVDTSEHSKHDVGLIQDLVEEESIKMNKLIIESESELESIDNRLVPLKSLLQDRLILVQAIGKMKSMQKLVSKNREYLLAVSEICLPCSPLCVDFHLKDAKCYCCRQSWSQHGNHTCADGNRGSFSRFEIDVNDLLLPPPPKTVAPQYFPAATPLPVANHMFAGIEQPVLEPPHVPGYVWNEQEKNYEKA